MALVHTAALKVLVEIGNERVRQIDVEGWTQEHDDQHDGGEMARAGACYALSAGWELDPGNGPAFEFTDVDELAWPWESKWWKPKSPRLDLIRAAALIVAEIEKIDRA